MSNLNGIDTNNTYNASFYNDLLKLTSITEQIERLYSAKDTISWLSFNERVEDIKLKIRSIAEKNNLLPSTSFFSNIFTSIRDFFSCHIFQSFEAIEKRYLKSVIARVESSVHDLFNYIKPHTVDVQAQKKWVEFGFSPDVIEVAPSFINHMYQSGLLFAMRAFSKGDSSQQGLRKTDNGSFEVLFEGTYIPLHEFENKVYYDRDAKYAMYKEKQSEAHPLRYVAPPIGFSRVDRKSVRGVRADTLSKDEFDLLKLHAAKFKDGVDPKAVKGVLQICTRLGRGNGLDLPEVFYQDGNEENIPPHYFFRIIDSEGNVYAKGVGPRKAPSLTNFASIIPGYLDDLDYMEFRKNPLTITSIPIMSDEKIDEIFDHLHSRPHVFSFPRYNCTTVVKEILGKIGEEVDLETSIEDFFVNAIRKPFSKIPVIGPLAEKIGSVFNSVQKAWKAYVPRPIRVFLVPVTGGLSWLTSCIATIARSVLALSLGGSKVHPAAREELKRKGIDPSSIQCVSSWKNLVYPEHQRFHSGLNLLKWQKKQKTTEKLVPPPQEPRFQVYSAFEKEAQQD